MRGTSLRDVQYLIAHHYASSTNSNTTGIYAGAIVGESTRVYVPR